MADDDEAGAILQPTVRHLVSKQDELLKALHISRRGQHNDPSAPWKKQRPSRTTSPASTVPRNSRKAPTKRKRGALEVETKLRRDRSISDIDAKQSDKTKRKRRRALGQRDWSEVLGMAAMMGWDQAAIDRAARRCAAIFDEGMSMRFMAGDVAGKMRDQVVDYVPDMVPDIHSAADPEEESVIDPMIDPVVDPMVNVFRCPYKSCNRYGQPFAQRWRFREHLRRTHKLTNEVIQRMDEEGHEADTPPPRSVIEISSAASSSSYSDDGEDGEDDNAASQESL
jgi:hypothetical protein